MDPDARAHVAQESATEGRSSGRNHEIDLAQRELLKPDAQPVAIHPHDLAAPVAPLRQYKFECGWDAKGAIKFEASAGLGQIAHGAGDGSRAEKNLPGLQHPQSRRHAPFFHWSPHGAKFRCKILQRI
jgi:hypothetical protein